jgi:parallel beta-helix repeat protein
MSDANIYNPGLQKREILYARNQGGAAISNQCNGNQWAGIMVTENAVPQLESNTCKNNQAGIYIAETANPELVNNYLSDNLNENLVDLRK